jgi:hypothetical protein
MKLLRGVFHVFFGCRHGQLSRVFTINNRTYQVCFECGRELDYSWEQMHSLDPRSVDNAHVPPNSPERIHARAV